MAPNAFPAIFFQFNFFKSAAKINWREFIERYFFWGFLDVYLQTHNLRNAKPQMHLGNYPSQLFRRRRCLFVLKIIPSISAKILRRPLNSRHRSAEFFSFYDDNFCFGTQNCFAIVPRICNRRTMAYYSLFFSGGRILPSTQKNNNEVQSVKEFLAFELKRR